MAQVTLSKKKRGRLLPGLSVKDGYTPHPFDLQHGVRTSGLIAGRYLKSGHTHDRHITAYYGVAPSVFARLLQRWQRTSPAAGIEETVFLDIGAGMGRAVLLASQMPFRSVAGIEIHPYLAAKARKNLRLWRAAGFASSSAKIVQADATEYEMPSGPVVAFLFNPFGAVVFQRVLSAWKKQFFGRSGQLDILYVNNEQEDVLERAKGFERLYLGKIQRSMIDAVADHKILANQPDGEYASSNYEDCSIWRWVG